RAGDVAAASARERTGTAITPGGGRRRACRSRAVGGRGVCLRVATVAAVSLEPGKTQNASPTGSAGASVSAGRGRGGACRAGIGDIGRCGCGRAAAIAARAAILSREDLDQAAKDQNVEFVAAGAASAASAAARGCGIREVGIGGCRR